MIYFTADNHFCHSNIIASCGRPFENVDEMNKAMIDNWNSRITNRDEIYILGDFLFKGKGRDANDILSKLKGKKYLIIGNHEKYLADPLFKPETFEWISHYNILKIEGEMKIILFHFPLFSWDGSHHGSIHLYGHIHNRGIQHPDYGEKLKLLGPRAVNVGVDVNNFYPVSIKEILERAANK